MVTHDQDYDPTEVERCVIFLKTGSFARMVKRTEQLKDKRKFYLVPTKAMILKLGLNESDKKKKDTEKGTFDSVNGYYIKEIPEHWIQWIDVDPSTLRCYAYCDWDITEYYNPAQDKLTEQTKLLESVTRTRNSYAERIASLERSLAKHGRYGNILRKEVTKEVADQMNKSNPLTQESGSDEK
jgi:hypothetical protein